MSHANWNMPEIASAQN